MQKLTIYRFDPGEQAYEAIKLSMKYTSDVRRALSWLCVRPVTKEGTGLVSSYDWVATNGKQLVMFPGRTELPEGLYSLSIVDDTAVAMRDAEDTEEYPGVDNIIPDIEGVFSFKATEPEDIVYCCARLGVIVSADDVHKGYGGPKTVYVPPGDLTYGGVRDTVVSIVYYESGRGPEHRLVIMSRRCNTVYDELEAVEAEADRLRNEELG